MVSFSAIASSLFVIAASEPQSHVEGVSV
jgi:hypothetical protein